jgi:hypothetical protein
LTESGVVGLACALTPSIVFLSLSLSILAFGLHRAGLDAR